MWAVIAAGLLFVPTALADQATLVWQIGRKDHSFREFAFDGDMNAYNKDFPHDVTFIVGKSDPKTDFSGYHPGARDKWVGRREHPFKIIFDMRTRPGGLYLLTVDLVDTESFWPPTYRVSVNGAAAKLVLQRGTGDVSLLHPEKGKGQSLRFVLAADRLKQGTNTIELCGVRGSWLLYDSVSLRKLPAGPALPIELTVKPSMFFVQRAGELKQEFALSTSGISSREPVKADARAGHGRRKASRSA